MQSTDKISATIHQIFKTINVVYDPTVISFDDQQIIVIKFKKALELASNIDISNVAQEVWSASSDISKYNNIVDIMNDRFDPLLTWKPHIYDIIALKESLKIDLTGYFVRLNQLGVAIIPQFKEKISFLYIQIGLRFLKVNLDLDKIMNELERKSEISGNEGLEKMYKAAGNNIKLAPNKIQDFTRLIFKLYYENYFFPLDNKKVITEIDVVIAFEKFFDIKIIGTENFSYDFYSPDNEIFNTNVVEKPLEIASSVDTTTPLKSFFSNSASSYFIDNIPVEFKIEYGKSIAILIYVLKNFDPCLLTIPYRKAKMFHKILKAHFKRDIGSYQSIFNFKVDKVHDRGDIEIFKNRIESLYTISNSIS